MIRPLAPSDIDPVLDIWLDCSTTAHRFIPRSYWEGKRKQMRDDYLPASLTVVWEDERTGTVAGFLSLVENYIAALFVQPAMQGRGVGKRLLEWAKAQHDTLELAVYVQNARAVSFYRREGFRAIREQIDSATGSRELVMRYAPLH